MKCDSDSLKKVDWSEFAVAASGEAVDKAGILKTCGEAPDLNTVTELSPDWLRPQETLRQSVKKCSESVLSLKEYTENGGEDEEITAESTKLRNILDPLAKSISKNINVDKILDAWNGQALPWTRKFGLPGQVPMKNEYMATIFASSLAECASVELDESHGASLADQAQYLELVFDCASILTGEDDSADKQIKEDRFSH